MKNRLYRVVSGLVLLVPLVGCGAESVDMGDNDPDTLAGTWVGSLLYEVFLTNPQTLRLEIDATGHGTLLVGDTPLPPPTNPAVGYPPEAQADAGEATGLLLHLYDGVTYPTENVQVSGTNLSFAVDAMHAFDPWCRLQVPFFADGGYRCRENLGVQVEREGGKRCYEYPNGVRGEEEDCLAIYLCSIDNLKGCLCTATECTAGSVSGDWDVTFDLELSDDGSVLRGPLGGALTTTIPAVLELHRQSQE
jgi:hypothetical protein